MTNNKRFEVLLENQNEKDPHNAEEGEKGTKDK